MCPIAPTLNWQRPICVPYNRTVGARISATMCPLILYEGRLADSFEQKTYRPSGRVMVGQS